MKRLTSDDIVDWASKRALTPPDPPELRCGVCHAAAACQFVYSGLMDQGHPHDVATIAAEEARAAVLEAIGGDRCRDHDDRD